MSTETGEKKASGPWAQWLNGFSSLGQGAGVPILVGNHCDAVQATLLCELGLWSEAERVLTRAISGERLELGRETYVPVGMQGWSHVVFRRAADKSRHVLSLDFLLAHLDDWEAGAR